MHKFFCTPLPKYSSPLVKLRSKPLRALHKACPVWQLQTLQGIDYGAWGCASRLDY